MAFYDIFNPGPNPRVLYDGIKRGSRSEELAQVEKTIRIAPGETRKGIELADHVVKRLAFLRKADPQHSLKLVEAGKAELELGDEPPAKIAQAARK
jgi:hypothetical protein